MQPRTAQHSLKPPIPASSNRKTDMQRTTSLVTAAAKAELHRRSESFLHCSQASCNRGLGRSCGASKTVLCLRDECCQTKESSPAALILEYSPRNPNLYKGYLAVCTVRETTSAQVHMHARDTKNRIGSRMIPVLRSPKLSDLQVRRRQGLLYTSRTSISPDSPTATFEKTNDDSDIFDGAWRDYYSFQHTHHGAKIPAAPSNLSGTDVGITSLTRKHSQPGVFWLEFCSYPRSFLLQAGLLNSTWSSYLVTKNASIILSVHTFYVHVNARPALERGCVSEHVRSKHGPRPAALQHRDCSCIGAPSWVFCRSSRRMVRAATCAVILRDHIVLGIQHTAPRPRSRHFSVIRKEAADAADESTRCLTRHRIGSALVMPAMDAYAPDADIFKRGAYLRCIYNDGSLQ